ncbi:hypothetical protein D3C78_1088600 [compost metagenome]
MQLLPGIARVALAVAVVGNISRDTRCAQLFEPCAAVVAGIGGVAGVGGAQMGRRLDHRGKQGLFRARAMGLGFDDDLRLLVHGSDTGVALDHPLAGGHLGRLVVGAVGQVDPPLGALAIFRVLAQPGPQLPGAGLQALELARGAQVFILRATVALALLRDHRSGGLLHLLGLAQEVGAGAAAGLAGVARQLHPVDGEHLAADQPLAVADGEHLGEQPGRQIAHVGYERGQGGEVRLAVAGHRHEQHMLAAGGFHLAAADDAAAVGQQDDLQQHRRIVGRSAFDIVAVAGVEFGEVQFVVDQIAQGVLEAAGQQLLVEIHGEQFESLVNGLEPRHRLAPPCEWMGRRVSASGRASSRFFYSLNVWLRGRL